MIQSFKIWTDGGARGNPGPAAIGGLIVELPSQLTAEGQQGQSDGQDRPVVLYELSRSIGETTNNQAEYQALVQSLEWLQAFHHDHNLNLSQSQVSLLTDSELMAYQIQGRYKVKNAELRPLYQRAIDILGQFAHYTIEPIPRAQNQVADRLVNQALDSPIHVTAQG